MPNHTGIYGTGFSRVIKALSLGVMFGTAVILPVFQHESAFYHYLTLSLFAVSTFIHSYFIWEALVRHFGLALVMVAVPVLFTLPYSHTPLSFLPSRIPILIMWMSFFVEEYARRIPTDKWHRKKARPDVDLKADRYPIFSMHTCCDELLVHMNGGEMKPYQAPSQMSSDISLSDGHGKLPSSCDSMTRSFWPDKLAQEGEVREESGDEKVQDEL